MSADDEFERAVEARRTEVAEARAATEAAEQICVEQRRGLEQFVATFLLDMAQRGIQPPAQATVVTHTEERVSPQEPKRGPLSGLWRKHDVATWKTTTHETDVRGWMVFTHRNPGAVEGPSYFGVAPQDATKAPLALMLADSSDWFIRIESGRAPGAIPEVELHPAHFKVWLNNQGEPQLFWTTPAPYSPGLLHLEHSVSSPMELKAALAAIAAASRAE